MIKLKPEAIYDLWPVRRSLILKVARRFKSLSTPVPHDNARPHKTKLVKSVLESMKVTELEHPPYSPDLAPCDFWLFARLKKDLAGKHFKNRIDLGNAVWRSLKSIPQEDYKQVFFDWLSRLKRVIECKGDYIEKM